MTGEDDEERRAQDEYLAALEAEERAAFVRDFGLRIVVVVDPGGDMPDVAKVRSAVRAWLDEPDLDCGVEWSSIDVVGARWWVEAGLDVPR
jgi:hypothetical protein